MKTLIRHVALTVLLVVGVTLPSYAQVIIDTTTLSNAITSVTATTITIGSVTCTNCTFGQDTLIFTTTGEAMRVTGAYPGSGTTVPVRRGTDGTMATNHATSERVYLGPAGRFHIVAAGTPGPGDPHGTCVRGQAGGLDRGASILPWINVTSGNLWNCDGSGIWRGTNAALITYNSTLAAGTQ